MIDRLANAGPVGWLVIAMVVFVVLALFVAVVGALLNPAHASIDRSDDDELGEHPTPPWAATRNATERLENCPRVSGIARHFGIPPRQFARGLADTDYSSLDGDER